MSGIAIGAGGAGGAAGTPGTDAAGGAGGANGALGEAGAAGAGGCAACTSWTAAIGVAMPMQVKAAIRAQAVPLGRSRRSRMARIRRPSALCFGAIELAAKAPPLTCAQVSRVCA